MRGGVDDKGKKLPELIDSYEDFSSDTRVKFVVKLKPAQMKNARDQGIHEYLGKIFFLAFGSAKSAMLNYDEMLKKAKNIIN